MIIRRYDCDATVMMQCMKISGNSLSLCRRDQDEFTVMSHTRAAAAHSNGLYKDEIIPVEGEYV